MKKKHITGIASMAFLLLSAIETHVRTRDEAYSIALAPLHPRPRRVPRQSRLTREERIPRKIRTRRELRTPRKARK